VSAEGARNRRTLLIEEAAQHAIRAAGDPLEFLLGVMNDLAVPLPMRISAAQAALPYCRAKISPVQMPAESGGMTFEQWLDQIDGSARKIDDLGDKEDFEHSN